MKVFLHIYSLMIAFAVVTFCSCSEDWLPQMDGEKVSVTFQPILGDVLCTRAIGDATGIDQLVVSVYEGKANKSKVFSQTYDWTTVQNKGVSLSLIEGRTYQILFWAEDKDNTAYTIANDGTIQVNYTNYLNAGFGGMETLDAFCKTTTVTVGTQPTENKGEIKLSRPMAQINFADNSTQPVTGSHQALVTYHGLPTAFNPFTGEIAMSEEDVCFKFTDFPEETLSVDGTTYYYIASNYVFVPQTGTSSLKATLDLQDAEGTSIKKVEVNDIGIELNKRTNILGDIVQQPETWSVWDGTIPSASTITMDDQNRYIIDEAADIAWLSVNAGTLAANSTFLMTKDMDMDHQGGLSAIQLPQGCTFDGNGHTIKALQLTEGLFGDAKNITVRNLNVENISVASTATAVTHVGVLANTLKGSSTFSGVHISDASVLTENGAAGGIVGYVSRISSDSRTETLTVSFDDCHVEETTITGTRSEGHFVGLLRGYDNGETLQFNNNCTISQTVSLANNFVSPYREGNEGVWLAANDYSKFDGWLGNEECYRGTVMYGTNRFIPCWDGSTKVSPLTDGTTKLIYSAFDLAALQGTSAGDVKLMENVCMEYDLDGASKEGVRTHLFTPLSTLNSLEGNGKTIYNITITGTYYSGFVKSESCTTTFKNVNFDGADIRVTHDAGTGDAYVGTLRGFAYANTTIENVHVRNGYLYGVNKMGGLCGGVFSTLTCTDSSVENYNIENYNSGIKDGGFYAYGECGGLIGMIVNAAATISNCSVKQTTMNCIGQNDKWLFITIPGRHINDFIGDIRLDNGSRVDLIDNSVSDNQFTNRARDTHSSKCPIVGKCYKISGTAGTVYIGSTKVF